MPELLTFFLLWRLNEFDSFRILRRAKAAIFAIACVEEETRSGMVLWRIPATSFVSS